MVKHLDRVPVGRVLMVTECAMSDNVSSAHPALEFVRMCTLCPHMKKITLKKTLASLRFGVHEVDVPEEIRRPARRALERMLEVGRDD